jgi:hypothetical protein
MAEQIGIQEKWQYCNKCCCLFYAGGQPHGKCAAGGEHNIDPSTSYNYQVLFTKGSPYHA